jgi:hypothetical protein
MGFLAPAVPWIIKGGAMLGGAMFGKGAQNSAMKRSPEEQVALAGANSSAGNLRQIGTSLMDQGRPYMKQAGDYYSTLLNGNRSQMAMATAGPRAAITDVYRGAESNLERTGMQGASRDLASATLNRDRASKLAGLTTGVQPGAAAALAGMGGQMVGQGTAALTGAGNIWQNLLGQGFVNRRYAREEGERSSEAMGGMIFDILSGTFGKKPFDINTAKIKTGKVDDIPGLFKGQEQAW